MHEMDLLVIPALLFAAAVIFAAMVTIIFSLWRISRILINIEKRLATLPDTLDSTVRETTPSSAEKSPGGAFETFLNEDPTRLNLSKNEQFAAYRKWRQENGLNWSGS